MSTTAEAKKAIFMFNGKEWMNRELRVNGARPQPRSAKLGRRRSGGDSHGGWREENHGKTQSA